MDPTEKKPKSRVVLIVLGVIVVLAILAGAGYTIYQTVKPKPVAKTETPAKVVNSPATDEQLNSSMTKLSLDMAQVTTSHQKAQDSLNDSSKRIKLSN